MQVEEIFFREKNQRKTRKFCYSMTITISSHFLCPTKKTETLDACIPGKRGLPRLEKKFYMLQTTQPTLAQAMKGIGYFEL